MFTQTELDDKVKELADKATRPIIDASVREIVTAIKEDTGYEPSTALVWKSLQRVGAVSDGKRWAWRHNQPKGAE